MAVRIRLKKMGRAHRPFYRVCAFDHHAPRDGRALEELGTYDTSITNTDARAVLDSDRIDYWLSVGAQPSEKVAVLIKKYGTNGTHLDQQKVALEELAAPRVIPDPGAPASLPKKPEEAKPEEAKTEAAATPEAATPEAATPAAESADAAPAAEEAPAAAATPEAASPEAASTEAATPEAATPEAPAEAAAEATPAEEEAPKTEA